MMNDELESRCFSFIVHHSAFIISLSLYFAQQLLIKFLIERLERVKLRDGGCAVACFEVGHAEIVVGFGHVWTNARGLFVGFDGFVESSGVVVGVAEFVVGLG